MNKTVYLILVSILGISGCKTKMSSTIPEQRPHDLQVDCFVGGGMVPESERYTISNDSAVLETYFQGIRNRWRFVPDPAALDNLWKTILENNFMSIKTRNEGEVYDRGGVNIDIDFGAQHFGINDSGSDFLEEKDKPQFSAVYAAIMNLLAAGLEDQAHKQSFILQRGMPIDSIATLGIQVDREYLWNRTKEKKEALPDTVLKALRPGKYLLNGWGSIYGKNFSLNRPFTVDTLERIFRIQLEKDSTWMEEVVPEGKTYKIILDTLNMSVHE